MWKKLPRCFVYTGEGGEAYMERAAVPSMVREERLRRWIDQYADPITKVCFASLQDRALAEDACQDTFLKAWKHMETYERKHIQNDKAWLMRIAVNICRDYRRSAWLRHVDGRASLDQLPEIPAAEGEDRALAMDICRLPEKLRQPVLLYYYQGLTIQETAGALAVPQTTVHRRLKKARELLKESLRGGDEA